MSMQLDPDGYQPPKTGLWLLQGLVLLLFLIFLLRFWFLQVHHGTEFAKKSRDNRIRQAQIYAPRGLLRARNGELLAENRPAYGLGIVREDVKDIDASLKQISLWTGVPLENIEKRYKKGRWRTKAFEPLLVVPTLDFSQLAIIEANSLDWPGLEVMTRPQRYYPEGELFAHILGYVSEANEKELEAIKELDLGDTVGKQGLELIKEDTLRGTKGLRQMEVDISGREYNSQTLEEPSAGSSVSLSIDLELQRIAAKQLEGQAGCVVVMNPDTGELYALVTTPSFDPNAFTRGLSHKEWGELRDNPKFPLQNRVIQSVYPPASIWKLLMAGLYLQEGIDPNETIKCNGKYKLGNHTFRCWKKWGHGPQNLTDALVHSCDVYFYEMGQRIGIDKIEAFARKNGFGSKTGIDLPHERSGLVPSKAWKRRRFNQPWQGGETVITSIGQGFTLVTPVQMAVFISSLLNEKGELLKPNLFKGAPKKVQGISPLTREQRAYIVKAMQETVEAKRGTARILRTKKAIVGGKTGTAQVVKLKIDANDNRLKNEDLEYWQRDHAWMAAWAKFNGKKFVVVTMVEHGGGGSSTAGPMIRNILNYIYENDK
ncbi:penicillin-binding protein 2 [Halodesulfovibrio sp. MK-HDV]|uniref:penicillin-binding protein 2 n=1 Tax=unclassified Halodesulfovibrio TaxID=2644657 RepID=UPI00136F6307|nr:penicillin-binding protein 2 [Halodesulfovibrio sp. MK-HDV]KAF1076824.1 Peptidoglycan D,D-transpeptidase MrdA [Halodesulfovibrio sp. MK-HDV]